MAARLYGVVGEDGRRSHRAVFVIDQGGALLHEITWYQPGNIGKFMEIFQTLGVVEEKGLRNMICFQDLSFKSSRLMPMPLVEHEFPYGP